ncbi:glycosyltransferase [uncultured Methylobacterium sp.]|uniref:glycosyltransferase n=1 Tax=uncultured Methylobacterium sp. TaxID=157278 RepID=UPI0035CC88FE
MKIAVTSTFDIDPANDGGRRRYQAMLGELAKRHDVTLVGYHLGSFSGVRSYRLGARLQAHIVSATDSDTRHCWHDFAQTQRIAHDVFCIKTYYFNKEFLSLCAEHMGNADVVIVSHPYMIMPVLTYKKYGSVQIYESHNVEYDAKVKHFADIDPVLRDTRLADVAWAERLACQTSNYVTAVSAADARRLEVLYDLTPSSVHVAANGVHASSYPRFGTQEKAAFRAKLGIRDGDDVAVFVGSGYGPNVESYRQARAMLQAAGFTGCVILIGSIAQAARSDWPAVTFREIWLGFTSDEVRNVAIGCADFALQIMTTGAGTNLKLFDYMASYTPIVANEFGARGVPERDWYFRVETSDELGALLAHASWKGVEGERVAQKARDLAVRYYDWSVVAEGFDQLISGVRQRAV